MGNIMEKSKLNSETNFVNLKDDFLIKIDERLSLSLIHI